MPNCAVFKATFKETNKLSARFKVTEELHASFGEFNAVFPDPYTGETEITPSAEAQVIPTAGLTMLSNITVNPIPSNYGLITWNGSTLTVS